MKSIIKIVYKTVIRDLKNVFSVKSVSQSDIQSQITMFNALNSYSFNETGSNSNSELEQMVIIWL